MADNINDGQHRAIWTSLRSMKPCPAAMLLESRIGERFEGQWERLVEIQEIQMELISEVRGRR